MRILRFRDHLARRHHDQFNPTGRCKVNTTRVYNVVLVSVLSTLLLAGCDSSRQPAEHALAQDTDNAEKPEGLSAVEIIEVTDIVSAAMWGEDRVVAVSERALRIVDLTSRKVTSMVELPGGARRVMVAGDTAYVIAERERRMIRLYVVDLTECKILRTQDYDRPFVRAWMAVLPDGNLALVAASVLIINPGSGKILSEIDFPDGIAEDAHLVGDRLYVACSYPGGVAIVDTTKGQLLKVVDTEDWLAAIWIINHRSYVRSSSGGGLCTIDLASGSLEKANPPLTQRPISLWSDTSPGTLLAITRETVHKLDADLRVLARSPLPSELQSQDIRIVKRDGEVLVLEVRWVGIATLDLSALAFERVAHEDE